jgi:hypothetical protein
VGCRPCRYKDFCLLRAEELGVATARLPIKKYVQLDSRAVLTINHVVQIMVEMLNRYSPRCSQGLLWAQELSKLLLGVCFTCLRILLSAPPAYPPRFPPGRHDWQAVLDEVLPPRKRAGFKEAKAEAKAKALRAGETIEVEGDKDGVEGPSGSEHGPMEAEEAEEEDSQEPGMENKQGMGGRKRKAESPSNGQDAGPACPG